MAGRVSLLRDCEVLQKCTSMNFTKIKTGVWAYPSCEVTLQQLRLDANRLGSNFVGKGSRVLSWVPAISVVWLCGDEEQPHSVKAEEHIQCR